MGNKKRDLTQQELADYLREYAGPLFFLHNVSVMKDGNKTVSANATAKFDVNNPLREAFLRVSPHLLLAMGAEQLCVLLMRLNQDSYKPKTNMMQTWSNHQIKTIKDEPEGYVIHVALDGKADGPVFKGTITGASSKPMEIFFADNTQDKK